MKNKVSPPLFALSFFRWYCHRNLQDYIEGDLMEVYGERKVKSGKLKADLRFIVDVLLLFRPGIIKPAEGYKNVNHYGMYKNYLTTAWRNIVGKKTFAAINVSGLALGIACALLIFSLVNYHLGFDDFHNQGDRIYRFVTEEHRDQIDYEASVPPVFGKAFREDYTFGEKVARLCTRTDHVISVKKGGTIEKFSDEIAFAEPEFFDIFNFPLVAGKRDKMLTEPNTALITERIAKKYFGDEISLGKTFRFDNSIDFTVTGILKDIPDNTDLRSEIYFSYSTIKQFNEWYAADDSWGGITSDIQTFVRLQPGVDPVDVERVLPDYVKKYRARSKNVHHYKLQQLNDIHFNSKYGGEMDKTTILILSLVGFLLVFTACLNFINLATAQAVTRAKEVGVRKVLGSARGQLFWQFTVETGLIVLLATSLAFSAAYFAIPYINEFFDARITLNLFSDVKLFGFLLSLLFAVTFLSGAYPGVILSGFSPVQALKGKLGGTPQSGSFNLRRSLIVTQFTISQILLIGLIVMVYQMKYFRNTDMGFNHEAVVMIPTGSDDLKLTTLKEQFAALPQVENVSACFAAPASVSDQWGTSFHYNNRSESETFSVNYKGADENFLSMFNIDLVAGRNLTPSDTVREFIVNEKLVAKLGLNSAEEILGKQMGVNGDSWKGPIVGVVKDFHDQSFHSDIEAIFITTNTESYNTYAVKINMSDAATTLAALEKTWSAMYPEQIYQYDFLDDQIAQFYETEQRMMTMVQVFSFIALIIGGLGLYGLVSFIAVQKTKEIGIRKVLGGNVSHILWIFGKEFSYLVIIAFLIAAPIGWLIMSNWLAGYAYQVEIGIWVYALELAIILAVVLLTVGYRSVKAAIANPVTSLRSE